MSHDTDKLIRQLSLVAFLMAERQAADRPRREGQRRGLLGDVRRSVRAAVLLGPRGAHHAGLQVCHSTRSGTNSPARSLHPALRDYFLDRLDLKDDELAALQTALFYLDGKFAYAEPLRLALGTPRSAGPDSTRRAPTPPSACG